MTRPLFVLFLTVFIGLVGFGIIIPLLPFYATSFGASPTVVGLLFASFSAAQLIAAPILGNLSDRIGRRPILLFSLFGTVVSFVLLALANGLVLLFAARIVDGLSGGNITTARAYIADITTPENRAKSYGIIGAGFGLGFTLGPGIGAALAHVSYTAPIWAAAGAVARRDAARLDVAAGNGAASKDRDRRRMAPAARPLHATRPRPRPLGRSRVLDGVCRLSDDVRAVRAAALRLGRHAHRLHPHRVRRDWVHRPGRARRPDHARDRRRAGARRRVVLRGVRVFQPALDCVLEDLGLDRDRPDDELSQALSTTLVGLTTTAEDAPTRPGQFGADTIVRHLVGVDRQHQVLAIAGSPARHASGFLHAQRGSRDSIWCASRRKSAPIGEWRGTEHGGRGMCQLLGTRRPTSARGMPSCRWCGNVLGDVPLVGFFAGGEIARHHLYGYTGILTVFTTLTLSSGRTFLSLDVVTEAAWRDSVDGTRGSPI